LAPQCAASLRPRFLSYSHRDKEWGKWLHAALEGYRIDTLWPDPAGVLASVGIGQGMTVVDLCSGDGWFTLQIAKVARHVIAIDIDGKLLETARALRAFANAITYPRTAHANRTDAGHDLALG
jgi:protein-L-isoaspartate O-methyltransferase